ncbi:e73c51ca-9d65-4985-b4f4-84f01b39c0f9-CDS [Sclerotinia trifoliorum]|uniref:E73c51ca-9d65-4985-b4f4-84f01b39c0f9-CDS n=1 Tax=Sclerotinia trifoliorum TaxID=28548 RepID=A0A8H2VV98_9HELO|nr:e73c51ca-9d65-4985-b4f4-84f01b39c0f9-CDS [Sclerotinia trifoliorum]
MFQQQFCRTTCLPKPEVVDMLLRSILAALTQGENLSNTFRPAHLINSIQSFYRARASGPEETGNLSFLFSNLFGQDVLADTRIQDRDDKSYCIFEEVDRAYYKEGWRLNTPTSSEPYECYCGKLFPKLEALRKHFIPTALVNSSHA